MSALCCRHEKPRFCFPKRGLSREQQIRVFIKWAEAHPELLHESRRSGVIGAFVAAFPCN